MKRNQKSITATATAINEALTGKENPSPSEIERAVEDFNNYTGPVIADRYAAAVTDLFIGIGFNAAFHRTEAINRVVAYMHRIEEEREVREKEMVAAIYRTHSDDLNRRDSQIARLESAVRQMSANRAEEVIRATRSPYQDGGLVAGEAIDRRGNATR